MAAQPWLHNGSHHNGSLRQDGHRDWARHLACIKACIASADGAPITASNRRFRALVNSNFKLTHLDR
ncbi:hypothetical protein ACWGY7_00430 [Xanthomonas axonopodis pv. khayae]